jgi:hypothetical protein
MKDCINLITISLLIYLLYTFCQKEGYINRPLKDEPDDLQFYACHDDEKIKFKGNLYSTRGSNNYKLKRHEVGEPLRGTYSDFLDVYNIRDYDEIFHAPICESEYEFKGYKGLRPKLNFKYINNLNIPDILDHKDVLKEDEMLKTEAEYEKNSIKDPYYPYIDPKYIGNMLTYNDNTIKLFLSTHRSMEKEQLTHRYDKKYTTDGI